MRKIRVGGYIRKTRNGMIYNVKPHERSTSVTKKHNSLDVDYTPVRHLLPPSDTPEWKSSRVKRKVSFWKKLFRQDFCKSECATLSQKAFIDIDENGEGTVRLEFRSEKDRDADEFDSPLHKPEPFTVKIGPYADLTSLSSDKTGIRTFDIYKRTLNPISDEHRWDLSSTNLAGCNAENSTLNNIIFSDANLEESNFENANLRRSILKGALLAKSNLRSADLQFADLSGADLSDADLSGASLSGANLTGVNWVGIKMEKTSIDRITYPESASSTLYDKFDFFGAAETLGLSDSQMEFIISVGGIEVRDNETLSVVNKNFDAGKHHVPAWAVQNWVPPETESAFATEDKVF